MKRLSPAILLSVAIAAFAIVLAAEALWFRYEQQVARRARAALRQKIRERDGLLTQAPALDAANEQAIADDLARVRHALAEERTGLPHGEASRSTGGAPTQTIEAFFDIARFVERSRAAAAAAKVALRPDERFGFAAYANEGPAAEVLAQVWRQRVAVESLVEHLIKAQPRALLALRREAVGPAQPAARNQADDYFVMDRALSVRRPGDVDTLAFHVEFSGQTAALRNFLTGLADLSQPLLVRSVEVEPLPVASAAAVSDASGTPVPLVSQSLSKFAVVVESVLPVFTPTKAVP
ncbi:MAG: hypothetical protein WDM96_19760 [Lacunisphaera sp.]